MISKLWPTITVAAFAVGTIATVNAANQSCFAWSDPDAQTSSISKAFDVSTIVLKVSSRTAGAINSIKWNGQEFVNNWDHGRQFQSAMTFDGRGECFNPTEAGSRDDLFWNGSSSLLKTLTLDSASQLTTTSNPAYWLNTGENSTTTCVGGASTVPGQPSTVLFGKTVTLGIASAANVIKYDTTFTIPDAHVSANFEILAAYTPGRTFVNFWTFNTVTNTLTATTVPQGTSIGGATPFIISSTDGNYAVGVMARHVASVAYGASNFTDAARTADNATTKMSCLASKVNLTAGSVWPFTCYAVIGTLAQVQTGMLAVQANE